MTLFAKEVLPVDIEEEMRQSYLDYAMSVIVGRALPDARDGLKPVHRRVLYAMHEQGNDWNKAYRKSARIVGDVMGKYHPHGDSAIYDALVRMAQPFSLRYTLIDGQGNFGSMDGDSAAAMRYTEVRMARIAHELLRDIDRETVDLTPNYDESEREPVVLPTRIPNLLINGSSGIAVGMATNIPPHNLGEVIRATLALLDDPDITMDSLIEHLPGPDFPTGGIIDGVEGIHEAYRCGKGRVHNRAKATVETTATRDVIVVTELPYQVNKARLLEKIAELVKEKRLEGISELRDESDKDGVRVVIELKRGESGEVILNNLYQKTPLESVFSINMVALLNNQPRQLNLKQLLEAFIWHRREVVTRRSIHDLRKSRARAHLLEGLVVALASINRIIELIKAAANPAVARQELIDQVWDAKLTEAMLARADSVDLRPETLEEQYGVKPDGYHLSPTQAQAILDLNLRRLTGLEQEKIFAEYHEVVDRVVDLLDILENPDRLTAEVRRELHEVDEQYSDARRTDIRTTRYALGVEDLIENEQMVVTLSQVGYIKTQPAALYGAQRRGGRGKSATSMRQEDFIARLFVANRHDTVLFFTSIGKVYQKRVYDLPIASRHSRGRPIVNFLPLAQGETVNAALMVEAFDSEHYALFVTRNGMVKKTPLTDFARVRATGIAAIDLRGDDALVDVQITDGAQDVMLLSSVGKVVRFGENKVRSMGRGAMGVRGIRLGDGHSVMAMLTVATDNQDAQMLLVTKNGYGKCTAAADYRAKGRGTQGVIGIKTGDKNGPVVDAALVDQDSEVMLISDAGVLIRTPVSTISTQGRAAQGVHVMRLDEGESLIKVARVDTLERDDIDADGVDTDTDDTPDDTTEHTS